MQVQQKLIATARAIPPDEPVPYGFEKRVMARLVGVTPGDALGLWGAALWRAAMPCLAVAALVMAWNFWDGAHGLSAGDFSKEFESAVLVAGGPTVDSWNELQ